MSRDSSHTYLHLHHSHHADVIDTFLYPKLPQPDLQISPEHLPPNPEDEDDVVPDQHAAFGIQRATQTRREPEWRDLGIEALLARAERGDDTGGSGGIGTEQGVETHEGVGSVAGSAMSGLPGFRFVGGARGRGPRGLPRTDVQTREVLRAALGRRERAEERGGAGGGSAGERRARGGNGATSNGGSVAG